MTELVLDITIWAIQDSWTNMLNMPIDQQIALGIIFLSMVVYNLSASASYTLTRNGVEKSIIKVNKWPGRFVKLLWIIAAINIFNLWYTVAIIFLTVFITIRFINLFRPLLLQLQPVISDRARKKLENSF
jgi:hypothetical protein